MKYFLARPFHRSSRSLCRAAMPALVMAATTTACGRLDPGAGAQAAPPGAPGMAAEAPAARFVKFEEVSEWNGAAWASVAEFDLVDATGATLDRKGWSATADSAGPNDGPNNAIDGDPATLWHSRWDDRATPPPHALVINLGATVRVSGFRYLPRQDRAVNGTIAQYRFYVSADGSNWGAPVASGDFTQMSAPTLEKTVVFARQTANRPPVATAPAAQDTPMGEAVSLRVAATDPDGDRLSFSAADLPPGLSIAADTGLVGGSPIRPGDYSVAVSVADGKAPAQTVRFAWKVRPPAANPQALKPGQVRFVRLEEVSEINGQPWASVAELALLDAAGAALPRSGWKASADSADANDRPGNAIDGSPGSIWHSRWSGAAVPPPPHSLIVDLGRPGEVRGFRYLPRQDGQPNGTIAKYRFYTSADGVDWGRPVAEGDFTRMGAANAEKIVRF